MRGILTIALTILVAATFLPLIETNAWWVRMLDFPRLQMLVLLTLLGAAFLFTLRGRRPWAYALALGVAAAIADHAVKLAPYAPTRAVEAAECPAGHGFSVMVANVQLGNRDADALISLVRARRPDILLAMETDAWWDERLAVLEADMPHTVERITGSYFGMHLFSRLPMADARAKAPVEQDAPAISVDVQLPAAGDIRLIGVHPRPPTPGQSSTGRDGQLMWAALEARRGERPVVVAGDFNAVPWERTVERMQRVGRLVDPRETHGFLATYDAQSAWMKWPLDQVLAAQTLDVMRIERLPGIGSDHYPILASICRRNGPQAPPPLRNDDLVEAERTIDAALRGPAETVGD
jgi:endonuclease/exonuclease/phosphatase (EEP) superfamily protein YafD